MISVLFMLWHVSTCYTFLASIVFSRMDISQFCYSSIEGHLVCFYFWVTMENTAMNIFVQDFVCTCVFISVAYTSVSRFTGSCGNSKFRVLRNFPQNLTVF